VAILAWLRTLLDRRGVQGSLGEARPGTDLYDLLTGGLSPAGMPVNERTALSVGACYACIRLIAGAIAGLPLPVYRRVEQRRERTDHELWWLLNREPNEIMSAPVFWEYLVSSLLLSGDAFARIRRFSATDPRIAAFEPLSPRFVEVKANGGRLAYVVYEGTRREVLDQDDVLHVPGVGFDGLRGLSPVRSAARNAIGTAMAADRYAARFFSNGARPDFLLEWPGKLDDEAKKLLRESWDATFGGADRSHRPAIMTAGAKLTPLQMTAEDAQIIATRKFQVEDIARIFGVPPFMISDTEKTTSWGSGVEHMSVGFVRYTLSPHLSRFEAEINRKCFRSDRFFCEFSVEGLLRGDSKARAEYYRAALGGSAGSGWMTQNEVRQLENLPEIATGNELTRWTAPTSPATPPAAVKVEAQIAVPEPTVVVAHPKRAKQLIRRDPKTNEMTETITEYEG
jgi:HK97 family phage portal protein